MASATTSSYQAITIIALLVAAGILIFMALVYTQNQTKWAILDSAKKSLKGPISQLAIGYPSMAGLPTTATSVGASASVRDLTDKEQFSLLTFVDQGKFPYLTIKSATGTATVPLSQPPVKI